MVGSVVPDGVGVVGVVTARENNNNQCIKCPLVRVTRDSIRGLSCLCLSANFYICCTIGTQIICEGRHNYEKRGTHLSLSLYVLYARVCLRLLCTLPLTGHI